MRKITVKILATVLLLALALAAITSCGIVVNGDFRFGIATVETEGAEIAAAVILDASDRIALVRIDEIENGKQESKKQLGERYGMLSDWGSKLAEWDDQIAHLEHELVGMKAEDVAALAADDADITAGCTIYAGNYKAAVIKAAEAAKEADPFRATVDNLALTLNMLAGKAGAEGDFIVAVSAAALNRGYIMDEASKFIGAIPAECRLGLATVKVDAGKVAAAVIIDDNNRIISVFIDEFLLDYDKSKKELGDEYGMSAIGKKEWDEQITHLETTLVGKNADQIANVSTEDADVAAGCTVYIGNYTRAVIKAIDHAKSAERFSALTDEIELSLKFTVTNEGGVKDLAVDATATVGGETKAQKHEEASAPEELRFGLVTRDDPQGLLAATVVIDSLDRIAFVRIDQWDNSHGQSKKALGDNYGMLAAWGSQLAEWDDQVSFFETHLLGKNITEISTIALGSNGKPTGADVTAGCTIAINGHIAAVIDAINAAKSATAFTASKNDVTLTLTMEKLGDGSVKSYAHADVDSTIVASATK